MLKLDEILSEEKPREFEIKNITEHINVHFKVLERVSSFNKDIHSKENSLEMT